jgi:hypothetical protein
MPRLHAEGFALVGFAVALGWAFVGSLVLGLGTVSRSPAVAWLWLAGEAVIGMVIFICLILGTSPVRGDGT